MVKRKAKAKSARRARPSKVQRTLVRLEKALASLALRVDGVDGMVGIANDRVTGIEQFLEPELSAFHEKQTTAPVTNGPQASALTDPE